MTPWTQLATHHAWTLEEGFRLLRFARRCAVPAGGAGWLDDDGVVDPSRGVHTWITSRMVHVYSLGYLLGVPGSRTVAEQALAGLRGPLRDAEHGGWFASVGPGEAVDTTKSTYAHAFVVLAASTATVAGLDGAHALLDDALGVLDERFWEPEQGLHRDEWDGAWTRLDPYRGVNANMHSTEALLAATDATGDPRWAGRARRIAEHVATWAAGNHWRIPEHFDADWVPQLGMNRDRPDDPFKPYGATVGHGLEWSRLLLQVDAAVPAGTDGGRSVGAAVGAPPVNLRDAAVHLYARAVADGWAVDGAPGFVYTVDWDGTPVVRTRMHWVAAEAIGAAAALHRATGDPRYAEDYARWWDYAATWLVDPERGSWHHELDAGNAPIAQVWPGKPDLYHAFQATLLPWLPLSPGLAVAVRDGLAGTR